jgi:hypothetical protein
MQKQRVKWLLTVEEEAPEKLERVPAGQGEGALLPGGQNDPGGQGEHMVEPALLAVAKRPPAHDEGDAGAGAEAEGGLGVAREGGEGEGGGEEGRVHTKGQP